MFEKNDLALFLIKLKQIKNKFWFYLLFQIFAWSILFVHQIVVSLVLGGFSWVRTIIVGMCSMIGFTLTHFYRWHVKKYRFFTRKVKFQLSFGILALCVFAFTSSLFSYSSSNYFIQNKIISIFNLRFLAIFFTWMLIYGIWLSAYHLFHFFEFTIERKIKLWEQEKQLQETEREILQLQFNPHFLFNTLNAIRSLLLSNVQMAQKGFSILNDLLIDGYLQKGFGLISIREEVKIVEQYLALEKLRFQDKIYFEIQVSKNLIDVQIPAGILLTLVENAVKHGDKKFNHIKIQVSHLNDCLELSVENTGLIKADENKIGGLGLHNLQKRMELYFDNKFDFLLVQHDKQVFAKIHIFKNFKIQENEIVHILPRMHE